MANSAPIPSWEPIANIRDWRRYPDPTQKDPKEGLAPLSWVNYLSTLTQTVSTAPQRVGGGSFSAQSASLAATDISAGGSSAGLYSVSFYAAITTAGTVSSSLTVTLAWTDEGIPKTVSGAAVTGNTTSTVQADVQWLIYSDASAPITIATTYASVGATAMIYKLLVVLNSVQV